MHHLRLIAINVVRFYQISLSFHNTHAGTNDPYTRILYTNKQRHTHKQKHIHTAEGGRADQRGVQMDEESLSVPTPSRVICCPICTITARPPTPGTHTRSCIHTHAFRAPKAFCMRLNLTETCIIMSVGSGKVTMVN